MTQGEKAVFASAFVTECLAGKYPREAAKCAATAILYLRTAQMTDGPCLDIADDKFVMECTQAMLQ